MKNSYIEINEKQNAYFIGIANKQTLYCLIEVVYVETTADDIVISQTSEGWSLLNINYENSGINDGSNSKLSAQVYGGSPRILQMKDIKSNILYFLIYNTF